MRKAILVLLVSFLLPLPANAFRASHFKGLYQVTGEHRGDPKYVVVDVDTVGNIWAKWANGDLPADLEPIRQEPSILLGFTFRDGLFFNLERSALVGADSLAMPGNKTDTMQLSRKPNGTYELGVRIDNVVTFYDLGPKQDLPAPFEARINQLPQALRLE